jgi:L-malate glycosyltransferase
MYRPMNRKKILLVTTMYPTPRSQVHTTICHDFARAWVASGYDVRVIHFKSVFPAVFYRLARLFRPLAIKYAGNDKLDIAPVFDEISFNIEGVPVYSIPIFKYLPHRRYGKGVIASNIERIQSILNADDFIPDIMIGHFYNPQIEIISRLKLIYPKSVSCVVLHEKAEVVKNLYATTLQNYSENIDIWGFRSKSLRAGFEGLFWQLPVSFVNHSGISSNFFNSVNVPERRKKINKFLYVGQLIKRKYPSMIVSVLQKAFPLKDYELTYVGSGSEEYNIRAAAKKNGSSDRVKLCGQTSREDVLDHYDAAECFIMVSRDEAFGLVYLEAMSRGCITIAARNEGIDGVIVHGVNGFLCEAGNEDELVSLLRHIDTLSENELIKISSNAVETARSMTIEETSKNYIEFVMSAKSTSILN